jgi:hypothetical protein
MILKRNRGVAGQKCTTYYSGKGVALVQSLSHGKPEKQLQLGAAQYPELYADFLATVAAQTGGGLTARARERRALELVDQARSDARLEFPALFAPLRAAAHAEMLTSRTAPLVDETAVDRARAEEEELLRAEAMLIIKAQAEHTRARLDFERGAAASEPPDLPFFFRDKVVIHSCGHPPQPTTVRTTAEGHAKMVAAARAAQDARAVAAVAEEAAAALAEAEALAARERAHQSSLGLFGKKKKESEKEKAARCAAEEAWRLKQAAERAAALERTRRAEEEARAPTFQIVGDDALAERLKEALRLERGVSAAARGMMKAVEFAAREGKRR